MNIKIVNLTPHAVNFYRQDNVCWNSSLGWVLKDGVSPYLNIEPSKIIARCKKIVKQTGSIDGIPLQASEYGDIEGLPNAANGVVYLASQAVCTAAAKKGRIDVYYPDELVRNEKGAIVGCMALGREKPL
ncbi:MAG: hypothetical protein LBP51_01800 [Deferribacteraceae bacterium]|jgi:hypothetical protein|nr:hypothetical protein [Deferribacteraceae bacterium]